MNESLRNTPTDRSNRSAIARAKRCITLSEVILSLVSIRPPLPHLRSLSPASDASGALDERTRVARLRMLSALVIVGPLAWMGRNSSPVVDSQDATDSSRWVGS